jgi:hypothetical protein
MSNNTDPLANQAAYKTPNIIGYISNSQAGTYSTKSHMNSCMVATSEHLDKKIPTQF